MLTLNDSLTKRLVLENFMRSAEVAPFLEAQSDVAASELHKVLKQRPLSDLLQVVEMQQALIGVQINCDAILACFNRLDQRKRYCELQNYFIANGATSDIMAALFKLSQADTRTLRRHLPVKPLPGRRRCPQIEEREDIWVAWSSILNKENDIRERYYRLHQRFSQFSISVLWNVVHSFMHKPQLHQLKNSTSMEG